MKRRDRVSALFWLVFSGLIIWHAGRLPFGTPRRPRPGFLPLILGTLLAALSLLLLILSSRKDKKNQKEKPPERFFSSPLGWKRVALAMAALLIFNLFLETLGFLACTFLFLLLLFKTVEPQRWIFSFVTSAVISMGAYFLFQVILKSNLPQGVMQGVGF